eukprot:TRINITY_DN4791_c0_g1_i5.p1 TRINITY_DN4791_c0_g1~~TRINITY_DN4791_c0_g1_i5.p1  ORF type:complete len:345 (+),score=59.23 TRINITY_DN4791_c0_g1_i5:645-1679(+)
MDEAHRPYKVFRHCIADTGPDVEVYHEQDERFNVGVFKSLDGKYLWVQSASQITHEGWYIDADKPTEEFKLFLPRENGVEYSVYHLTDRFLITTNADGAKNFKLMEVLESEFKPGTKEGWKERFPYDPNVMLDSLSAFKHFLVLWERKGGMTTMTIQTLTTGELKKASFDEDLYTVECGTNTVFDTMEIQIVYQSLTTPKTWYQYDMQTHNKKQLKQEEVLGGYNPREYESKRIFAPSRDGKQVPISLVYKKNLFKGDGSNHMLLYGYGSYGAVIEPSFHSNRLSLLDRGFVYTIAHIRGGGSMGRPWYEDGKLLTKKNTFNDFVDCTKYLLEKWPLQMCLLWM